MIRFSENTAFYNFNSSSTSLAYGFPLINPSCFVFIMCLISFICLLLCCFFRDYYLKMFDWKINSDLFRWSHSLTRWDEGSNSTLSLKLLIEALLLLTTIN